MSSPFPKSSFEIFSEKYLTRYDAPEAAGMKYPNIYAEHRAALQTSFCTDDWFSLHKMMNVTPALCRAIMDGSEEITWSEVMEAQKLLRWAYRRPAVKIGYLLSNELAVISPLPWRREKAILHLQVHYEIAMARWPSHFNEVYPAYCKGVLEALERGETVTYAHYQFALAYCRMMDAHMEEWYNPPKPRDIGSNAPVVTVTKSTGERREWPIAGGIITDAQVAEMQEFKKGATA